MNDPKIFFCWSLDHFDPQKVPKNFLFENSPSLTKYKIRSCVEYFSLNRNLQREFFSFHYMIELYVRFSFLIVWSFRRTLAETWTKLSSGHQKTIFEKCSCEIRLCLFIEKCSCEKCSIFEKCSCEIRLCLENSLFSFATVVINGVGSHLKFESNWSIF